MPQPTPPDPGHGTPEQTRFVEDLRQNGQLVDVQEGADTTKLPPQVTHVRYPNGVVKRIRFNSGYH